MTYEAKIKIQFDSSWESTYTSVSSSFYGDDMLPEEHITMEIPAHDLNTIQLFKFFSNFLRAIGHTEDGIAKGACSVAFNEMRDEKEMRKTAEEYDLKLAEDYAKEFREMQDEIYDLKAKLSRFEQPDNPNYTTEEMDAMTHQEWNGLIPGSPEAVKKNCTCPVMDNQEMPDDRKWVNGDCPLHGKVK